MQDIPATDTRLLEQAKNIEHSHGHDHEHSHGHHHDHSHDLTPIDFEGEVLYPEPICADDVLIEILESMIQDYL